MALNLQKLYSSLVEFQKKYDTVADQEILDAAETVCNFIYELDSKDDELNEFFEFEAGEADEDEIDDDY